MHTDQNAAAAAIATTARALLIPVLATSLWACNEQSAPKASSAPPRAVVVAEASRSTRPIVTEVVGTVRAVRSATIAPLISGTVTEVRVALGSSVRAGEVLVRLSAAEAYARLEQSRAAAALAELERERATRLRNAAAISTAEYDQAVSRSGIAQARQTEASTLAEHSVIRAPFAGVITAKLVDAGDTAMPGQPLLHLEAPGALRFEARVPESYGDTLQVGNPVPVRLDGLERALEGTVVEIQPASDDATRTRLAKVLLPASPGLRSGRFGRLLLATGTSPAVTVPAGAVVRHGQLEGVFVVDAGSARLRLVRSGRAYDDRVEIAAGLSGDEQVVLGGTALVDGQRVEVAR